MGFMLFLCRADPGRLLSKAFHLGQQRQYPGVVSRLLPLKIGNALGQHRQFLVEVAMRCGGRGVAGEGPVMRVADATLHRLGKIGPHHLHAQFGEDLVDTEQRRLAGNTRANDLDERVSEVG